MIFDRKRGEKGRRRERRMLREAEYCSGRGSC